MWLLVEDDSGVRVLMQRLCRAYRETVAVATPAEALDLVTTRAGWSGFLIDQDLGGEDGLTLLTKLWRVRPGVPAVLVTGASETDVRNRALFVGVPVLRKPLRDGALDIFALRVRAVEGAGAAAVDRAVLELAQRRGLTERHVQIVKAAIRGCSRTMLAAELGVPESSVNLHVRALLERCGARSLESFVTQFLLGVIERSSSVELEA